MILLSVEGVRKRFAAEPLLDGVGFEVRPGEKIGLVGPNGAGKTTLLRILAGREEPDGGKVELHPSARVGYLEQEPRFAPGRSLWDEAYAALDELLALAAEAERVSRAVSEAPSPEERRRLAARFDRLHEEIDRRGAHNLDHKVERVLQGLGFEPESYALGVENLSGGQRNRLMLAKLLLAGADLLLLDEPSNHLDLEGCKWLEGHLAESSQAVIVVSHDRYFLDRVTSRTLELFGGQVESYPGGFSEYWRLKAERLELQRLAHEKQQAEVERAEDFIRRNHYGLKHAQAEDRRKKLARLERVAPPREIPAPPMAFPPARRSGDLVLRISNLAKGYDRPLFRGLSFEVERGQRWGILGPNACGKTTLLRCLVGEAAPDAGTVVRGAGVAVGYYDQRLEGLDAAMPAMDAVRPPPRQKLFNDQDCRDVLARFGLKGESALRTVESLSGGEKSRVALARLATADANLLVLDEPTNHLDLWARDALERALLRFDGTVMVVSHDRYFLNRVAGRLLVAEPDASGEALRFRLVHGNYDAYLHLVQRGLAGGTAAPAEGKPGRARSAAGAGEDPRAAEPVRRRRRRFPYRKVEDLEAEIFAREARLDELHAALAEPEVLRSGDRVRAVKTEIGEQKEALERLYEHWDEATELN